MKIFISLPPGCKTKSVLIYNTLEKLQESTSTTATLKPNCHLGCVDKFTENENTSAPSIFQILMLN